jgi:hypothetical protein
MTIRAGGRMALIAATGLLVCVAAVSGTTTVSNAASSDSESVSTTKAVKQAHKRHAHRKSVPDTEKSSTDAKPAEPEVAQPGAPTTIPAAVADANARMGTDVGDDTTRAMTARANALLTATDQPGEAQGAPLTQVVEADQLNDVDRALQEPAPAPAPQTTVAVAPTKPVAAVAKAAPSETSTWDQTSLIGKIFIAFGALLTVASAARMFMA